MAHCTLTLAAENNEVGFTVTPIFSDTQREGNQSFFDLEIGDTPEEQELKFLVSNTSKNEINLLVSFLDAKTNSYGQIIYDNNEELPIFNKDRVKFSDIVEGNQKLKLKKNETKEYSLKVKSFSNKEKGEILGAVQFINEQSTKDTNVDVNYGYKLGVRLTNDSDKVENMLKINKLKTIFKNKQKSFELDIANTSNTSVEDMSVDFKIIRNKDKKEIFKESKKNLRMAPNTVAKLNYEQPNEEFKDGEYTGLIEISKDNKVVLSSKEPLSVTKSYIDEIEKEKADNKSNIGVFILQFLICVIIVIFLAILIIFFKKGRFFEK